MAYGKINTGGTGASKELLNTAGTKIADLEKAGMGKVKVIGGLGDATTDKVLEGSSFTSENGVKKAGTMADVTPEVNAQTELIPQILQALQGKVKV